MLSWSSHLRSTGTALFQALHVLRSRIHSTSRVRPSRWNPSLSLTLCVTFVLILKTGEMTFSTSGLQRELSHLLYDNDRLHVCHATPVIIVIFIYHHSFKVNPMSDLAFFKSILEIAARVKFLKEKLDHIFPCIK